MTSPDSYRHPDRVGVGRRAPALRTVVLTSFGTEPNVLRALQHAAAGFLLKSASPDELIRAVRSAHAGAAYLSPEVTRLLLGLVTPGQLRQRREAAERLARLTRASRTCSGWWQRGSPTRRSPSGCGRAS